MFFNISYLFIYFEYKNVFIKDKCNFINTLNETYFLNEQYISCLAKIYWLICGYIAIAFIWLLSYVSIFALSFFRGQYLTR